MASDNRGAATRRDIVTQTEAWREAVGRVEAQAGEWKAFAAAARQILFVGCGSSYNVGVLAAAGWNALARISARAVSAGEYLRFRDTASARAEEDVVCLLSRSGATSETLAAMRQARGSGCPVLAICCTEDAPLARAADLTLALPAALEQAIIATRSVTAMGLAALLLSARAGNCEAVTAELSRLPETVDAAEAMEFERGAPLLPADVERVVFLGSGPLWATALAAQLVCQEMALVDAWAYPALEFRHGPIVLARPGTLVVLLASGAAGDLDGALFHDLGRRGCRRLWAGRPLAGTEPGDALPIAARHSDWARAILSLVPFQSAAWGRTVHDGRDPDDGSGLPRVVELPL